MFYANHVYCRINYKIPVHLQLGQLLKATYNKYICQNVLNVEHNMKLLIYMYSPINGEALVWNLSSGTAVARPTLEDRK